MKFCLNCHKQCDYAHVYCYQCGQVIQVPEDHQPPSLEFTNEQFHFANTNQKSCPHCHRMYPQFARYCPACGIKNRQGISPVLVVLLCFFGVVIMGLVIWLVIRSIDFSSLKHTPAPISLTETPLLLSPTDAASPSIIRTLGTEAAIQDTPVFHDENINDMVFIPSGSFSMGATQSDMEWHLSSCNHYAECSIVDFDDMVPLHSVELDSFFMDIHEVTNAEYRECVYDGVCNEPDRAAISKYLESDYYSSTVNNNFPVVGITWQDAMTFCNWDGGKELPSEAQWEYAAQGPDGWFYPWDSTPDGLSASSVFGGTMALANFCDVNCQMTWKDTQVKDGYKGPSPVMNFAPGAYGLYDMSGNVTEWIQDYYRSDYYVYSPVANPMNDVVSDWKVTRGGGWNNGVYYMTSVFRSAQDPDKATAFLGFRCVK